MKIRIFIQKEAKKKILERNKKKEAEWETRSPAPSSSTISFYHFVDTTPLMPSDVIAIQTEFCQRLHEKIQMGI
jgi:hypothetical protein